MLIRDYASHPNVMRKEDPTWKFALGASPVTEGSILRIVDEAGNEGFGYASSTPHMGAIPATLEAELAYFKPHVIGRDGDHIGAIGAALDRAMRGAPQAKAAIDCALHELLAKRLGVPLCQLFGGKVRDSVVLQHALHEHFGQRGEGSRLLDSLALLDLFAQTASAVRVATGEGAGALLPTHGKVLAANTTHQLVLEG